MRAYQNILLFSLTLLLWAGCEKEIDIDLPAPKALVVVDGFIENDQFAQVVVTRAIPYFGQIDFNTLAGTFIQDAVVVVSDGQINDTLQLTIDPNAFPPIFFKGTNPALKGQVGQRYFLTVIADGDTITGSTTIPQLVYLDSIYWMPDVDFNVENDSLGFGMGRFKDPDTIGNNYRLFSKRQDYPDFRSASRSVSDDRLVNGQDITFQFIRPRITPSFLTPDSLDEDRETRIFYKRGDTIQVRYCTLDRASYDYIRTYEIAAGSFGNPFAAPTFVRSNLEGGLGGFVGYGATYYTYIVPQ